MRFSNFLSHVVIFSIAAGSITAASAEPATGPYAGAFATWTTLPTDVVETEVFAPPAPPITGDGTSDPNGWGGTLLLGYRFGLAQNWLAGAEVDATWFDADDRYEDYVYSADFLATLRGVLGYQITPDLLLFATAGVAWLDFDVDSIGRGNVANDTLAGWVIGIGAENRLTKIGQAEVALRGDYLYANFEGQNFPTEIFVPPVPPASPIAEFYENDTELHQLRLGVVIRPN